MNRHADTQVRHRPYDCAELEVYACSAQSLPLHVVHTLQVVFVVVVGFRVIVLAAQVDVLHADGQTHVKDIVEIESPGEIILTDTSGRDPAHGRVDRSGFRQCAFTVRVLGRRAERGILFVVDRFE